MRNPCSSSLLFQDMDVLEIKDGNNFRLSCSNMPVHQHDKICLYSPIPALTSITGVYILLNNCTFWYFMLLALLRIIHRNHIDKKELVISEAAIHRCSESSRTLKDCLGNTGDGLVFDNLLSRKLSYTENIFRDF